MAIDVLGDVSDTKHSGAPSGLMRAAEHALPWAVRLFLVALVVAGLALPYI
jgi:hypothetical protein